MAALLDNAQPFHKTKAVIKAQPGHDRECPELFRSNEHG